MAQRVEVILEYDIDGSPADETVRFALNGTSYEIDLSSENAQALRGALGRYVEHAREAPGGSRQAHGPRKRTDTSAVREWAKAHGKELSGRGRIPASVMREYETAQGAGEQLRENARVRVQLRPLPHGRGKSLDSHW
jgi:hypothetical protein